MTDRAARGGSAVRIAADQTPIPGDAASSSQTLSPKRLMVYMSPGRNAADIRAKWLAVILRGPWFSWRRETLATIAAATGLFSIAVVALFVARTPWPVGFVAVLAAAGGWCVWLERHPD